MPVDPLRPARPSGSMACLPGIAPSGHHCRHARLSVDKYAGFSPNAKLANRMLEKAASPLPGNARPLVHSDRGRHCRWPGVARAHGTLRADAAP